MRSAFTLGTRDSQLALWQAQLVATLVRRTGNACDLLSLKSYGDEDTQKPLAELGQALQGKGVFTKVLDDALLDGRIDLAVHSYKDVPTQLPHGITIAAILRREDPRDVLVARNGTAFLKKPTYPGIVATGSVRRRAQWLARYPSHQTVDLRGNVNTRLKKVYDSDWDGAIFAAAGLKRLGLQADIHLVLDWMIPAPAQGAIVVLCRTGDSQVQNALSAMHDDVTAVCTTLEREVLAMLEGGCSAPVGVFAEIKDHVLYAKAIVLQTEGQQHISAQVSGDPTRYNQLAEKLARNLLQQGAANLVAVSRGL